MGADRAMTVERHVGKPPSEKRRKTPSCSPANADNNVHKFLTCSAEIRKILANKFTHTLTDNKLLLKIWVLLHKTE